MESIVDIAERGYLSLTDMDQEGQAKAKGGALRALELLTDVYLDAPDAPDDRNPRGAIYDALDGISAGAERLLLCHAVMELAHAGWPRPESDEPSE